MPATITLALSTIRPPRAMSKALAKPAFMRRTSIPPAPVQSSITTESVTGFNGIVAIGYAAGGMTITTKGDVEGTGGDGLTVTAERKVIGRTIGIYARNYGAGALTVTAHGDVLGDLLYGVFARNGNAVILDGTDLSVTAGGVTGGVTGINAFNFGTGALEIVAKGDVEGTGVGSTGIYARQANVAATGPLSITSEAVTGGSRGIDALNFGTGALEFVVKGDVEGTGVGSSGIYALNYNFVGGTSITVTTESVTGGHTGHIRLQQWHGRGDGHR